MTKTLYYWFKPGVERDHCSTVMPTDEYVKALQADGYKILVVEFGIPYNLVPQLDGRNTSSSSSEFKSEFE